MDDLLTLAGSIDLAAVLAVGATALATRSAERPPIKTVAHVDLERFMGRWFVIANIPTFVEQGAYNAVERYRLSSDGSVDTTFYCRKGGFDGKRSTTRTRAFVLDTNSNAIWGMQFLWPFKADYRISYLALDYSHTVIAREKRDYVWIMARTPRLSSQNYEKILLFLSDQGYDTEKIEKVPQRWERRPHVQQ